MTQTLDQTGRPNGHPGYCACPECFQWHQEKQSSTKAQWNELVLTPTEQTADYARRIHWWVRLFGIVWIVIPVVAMLLGIFFAVGAMTKARMDSPTWMDNPSYYKCLDTYTAAECRRMYPGK